MNSSTPKPRVASAGVPTRRPDEIVGGRGSNGHRVAVDGDADLVQPVLGLLAVEVGLAQVGEHEVDVGAAGEHVHSGGEQLVGERLQRPRRVRRWRSRKSSDCAILSATALAAITCISGPPC